jgi:hypothetical protein
MDSTDKLALLADSVWPLLSHLQATDPTLGLVLAFIDGNVGGPAGVQALIRELDPTDIDRGVACGVDIAARFRSDDAAPILIIPGLGAVELELDALGAAALADDIGARPIVTPAVQSELVGALVSVLGGVSGSALHHGQEQLREVAAGPVDLRGGTGAEDRDRSAGVGHDASAGRGDIPRSSPAA